jgi:cation-transporting ATPase E
VEQRTAALLVLFTVAMWVLVMLCRPLHAARLGLVAAMTAAFVAIISRPSLRQFFELEIPPAPALLTLAAVAAIAIIVLEIAVQAPSRGCRPCGRCPG